MTRPQAIQTARRMWAGGEGWKLAEIRDYLAARGHLASTTTIHTWVDDEYAAHRLEQQRESERRIRRNRTGKLAFLVIDEDAKRRLEIRAAPERLTPDLLLALRVEDKLSYAAIAAIVHRFFGEQVTEHAIRYQLNQLGAPKNPNKSRAVRRQHQLKAAA